MGQAVNLIKARNRKDLLALIDMIRDDLATGRIDILRAEAREVSHECKKDLVPVNGAMCCVGETEVLGRAYELYIIKKGKK